MLWVKGGREWRDKCLGAWVKEVEVKGVSSNYSEWPGVLLLWYLSSFMSCLVACLPVNWLLVNMTINKWCVCALIRSLIMIKIAARQARHWRQLYWQHAYNDGRIMDIAYCQQLSWQTGRRRSTRLCAFFFSA